jgi:hypothetical protein
MHLLGAVECVGTSCVFVRANTIYRGGPALQVGIESCPGYVHCLPIEFHFKPFSSSRASQLRHRAPVLAVSAKYSSLFFCRSLS